MKKKDKKSPQPVSRKTRKAIDELRKRYELGVETNQQTRNGKRRAKYGTAAVINLAQSDGSSETFVYDSQQFASQYSGKDFKKLIDQCLKYDFPVGMGHVVELLREKDPKKRSLLQANATKNRLNMKKIREIRRRK